MALGKVVLERQQPIRGILDQFEHKVLVITPPPFLLEIHKSDFVDARWHVSTNGCGIEKGQAIPSSAHDKSFDETVS